VTALPQWMYGDPARVLEGRETCDGCEHNAEWTFGEKAIRICDKGGRIKRLPRKRCDDWKHKDGEGETNGRS